MMLNLIYLDEADLIIRLSEGDPGLKGLVGALFGQTEGEADFGHTSQESFHRDIILRMNALE